MKCYNIIPARIKLFFLFCCNMQIICALEHRVVNSHSFCQGEYICSNSILSAYSKCSEEINFEFKPVSYGEAAPNIDTVYNGSFYKSKILLNSYYTSHIYFNLHTDSTFQDVMSSLVRAKGKSIKVNSILLMPATYQINENKYYRDDVYAILNKNILYDVVNRTIVMGYSNRSILDKHIKHIKNNLSLFYPVLIDKYFHRYYIKEYYDHNMINKEGEVLDSSYIYCYNIQELFLPEHTKSIGKFCFGNCINLKYINFNSVLLQLNDFAFYNCISLENVNLPNSVTYINDYTFLNCINLEYIRMPSSIKKIQRGTFQQCEKLDNIVIPASVEQIDEFAFLACSNLRTLISENIVPPKIKKYTFDIDNKITVFVPDVSVELYKSHDYWGKMKIKPMSELKESYKYNQN